MCAIEQPHFREEREAFRYLEAVRWPNGPVCPHCGGVKHAYACARVGRYRCADKACRKDFTVRVGTVFEDSPIKLHKWLLAAYLVCTSKKGISSLQLQRMLGVTYKTAWFMSHRLREAMSIEPEGTMGGPGEAVEVDETYWGNVGKHEAGARGYEHKMKIVSLVERNGEKRSLHVARVTAAAVTPILKAHIASKARVMTDELSVYTMLDSHFVEHGVVNHSKKEYARFDITTNTVESSFAVLKRGLYGTFHSVSEQHLQRYVSEFDFRWNTRQELGFNDTERTAEVLKNIGGKRLTYRRLDSRGASIASQTIACVQSHSKELSQ